MRRIDVGMSIDGDRTRRKIGELLRLPHEHPRGVLLDHLHHARITALRFETPSPFENEIGGERVLRSQEKHRLIIGNLAGRILKPGGSLEIWTPNGLEICRAFVLAEDGKDNTIALDGWYKYNKRKDPAVWAAGRIFSYGDGNGTRGHPNWHLSLFSERYLTELLCECGFSEVQRLPASEVRGFDHGFINMGVRAIKQGSDFKAKTRSTDFAARASTLEESHV